MKRLTILLSLVVFNPVFAAEDPFETVMTPAFSPITWERLINAGDEPENGLMYSGTLDAQRYSQLDEINTSNVTEMEL